MRSFLRKKTKNNYKQYIQLNIIKGIFVLGEKGSEMAAKKNSQRTAEKLEMDFLLLLSLLTNNDNKLSTNNLVSLACKWSKEQGITTEILSAFLLAWNKNESGRKHNG